MKKFLFVVCVFVSGWVVGQYVSPGMVKAQEKVAQQELKSHL